MVDSLPPTSENSTPWPTLMDLQQAALDSLPIVVSIYEIIDRSTYRLAMINRTFAEQYHVTAAEAVGVHLHEMLPPAGAEKLINHFRRCIDTGQAITVEDSYAVDNASSMWANSRFAPLTAPDGRITHLLVTWEDITERKKYEREAQEAQLAIIEEQAARLTELSTPLLTVSDSTMVMPLIGTIDDQRVQHLMESLLTGVSLRGATTVILDITGVPIVDTHVANALVRASQAVRLLGARVILTGIRPEVAQTLVGLGVDLSSIVTRGTLRDGIAYALR